MQVPRPLLAARQLVDDAARHSPARLAVMVFAGVIATFTALLLAPQATASGQGAAVADALFTAASAVCVTGLTTVDTATYWSAWGQVVILVGIKIGGLGVMTLASLLGMAVSRRIGLTQRLLTASETKISRLGEVGALLQVIIVTSTAIELVVAGVLFPRFLVLRETVGEAAWHALFYGVSAFNNAGFVPTAGGMTEHPSDWWIGAPVLVGVALGSLGFPVILDLWRRRTAASHWTLHTKLTLATSAVLTAVGALVIGAFEWTNQDSFGRLDGSGKVLASLMAGVMPRSGGFSTVPTESMSESSWLVTDALMFVGGGSASTAGGIKVTTLAVMVLAIIAEARGDRDVEAFGRRIPRESLRLAVAVAFVGATIVLLSSLALLAVTGEKLDRVLFEVISAFGTVGLSTGMTLPEPAKYLLSVLMFVGRTGTMTVAAALALRDRRRVIRYPEERPILG